VDPSAPDDSKPAAATYHPFGSLGELLKRN